jgi:hypothetical protein
VNAQHDAAPQVTIPTVGPTRPVIAGPLQVDIARRDQLLDRFHEIRRAAAQLDAIAKRDRTRSRSRGRGRDHGLEF